MRRLCGSLLLALFMLFAQQGALQHAVVHGGTPTGKHDQAPESDRCDLCLAFGQLGPAASTSFDVPLLLADLAFHHLPTFALSSADEKLRVARSRGPPAL